MKYTKAKAKESIEAYKDLTCYFDKSMTQGERPLDFNQWQVSQYGF